MYGKDTVIASKLTPNEDREGNPSLLTLAQFPSKGILALGGGAQLRRDRASVVESVHSSLQGGFCQQHREPHVGLVRHSTLQPQPFPGAWSRGVQDCLIVRKQRSLPHTLSGTLRCERVCTKCSCMCRCTSVHGHLTQPS